MSRKNFFKNSVRFVVVTVGIVVLTSLSVDATDSFRTSQTALSILAGSAVQKKCPTDTIRIDLADKSLCMDTYENAVGPTCTITAPNSALDTKKNIDELKCTSVSTAGSLPWVQVSYDQAKTLCAKRNMRLPTANEWYEAALGTPDGSVVCNTNGSLAQTGAFPKCVSARGAHDMVGNVWEWVDGQVTNNQYDGHTLPNTGYVADIDASGVAIKTDRTPSELYNSDYFWSQQSGVFAMMRGGFFSSGTDAGLYSVHADVTTSFTSAGTGFRCVEDL